MPDDSRVRSVSFKIPGDASATSVSVTGRPVSDAQTTKEGDIRQKWLSALEQCSQSTMRELSYSFLMSSCSNGGGGPRTSGVELEMDARCSARSILASGLALPKSPSFQKEEEAKGVASDAAQMEREERGWWALRFQQVLQEIQRVEGWP